MGLRALEFSRKFFRAEPDPKMRFGCKAQAIIPARHVDNFIATGGLNAS